jgi:LmbE family N-acetylglucosaminyl deacetylase
MMKVACVVAHPDDCVIFARPFIDKFSSWSWHIFYLTYELFHPRVREMHEYWYKQRNIPVTSLGYVDTHLDMENNQLSFNESAASKEILGIVSNFDLVLTHNSDGDYGHIHHKFVSEAVTKSAKPVVYFANDQQANFITQTNTELDLKQFPLHRDVIGGFNKINMGKYFISPSAHTLIYGNT